MPYEILASVCQHRIRTSDQLPWSGTTLDFDVRYCPSCEVSRSIREERGAAEREYNTHYTRIGGERTRRDAEYRSARRRYDQARLASAEDDEYLQSREDRDRRNRGLPTLREESLRFVGREDPQWVELQASLGRDRSTRFANEETLRRESQVHEQGRYRRGSRSYVPGSHADTSGYGYYNPAESYADEDDGYNPAASYADEDDEKDRELRRRLEEELRRFR